MIRATIQRYFCPSEFRCKCGCGRGWEQMSNELLKRIYWARCIADVPFILNSAFRCLKHNTLEGGSVTSSHLDGLAVDIAARDSSERYEILRALILVGFCRIGIYDWGFHVDVDGVKDQGVIWYG